MRTLIAFVSTVAAAALLCCVGDDPGSGQPNDVDGGAPPSGEDAAPSTDAPIPLGAAITLAKSSRWIAAGGKISVDFTIERNGVPGAMRVHVNGLPNGLKAT